MSKYKYIQIFETKFTNCTLSEVCGEIDEDINIKEKFIYYAVKDIALTVRSMEDPFLNAFYNKIPKHIFVDGKGILFWSFIIGKRFIEMIGGPRLFYALLKNGESKSYKFYFLGADQVILDKMINNLMLKYPLLNIVGARNGYFDEPEELNIVKDINNSQCDVLILGISTPQREKFIARNITLFGNYLCVPVGGVFDYEAGKIKYAPRIINSLGMEWIYRIAQEPRRLMKRYLYTHSKIIKYAILELIKSSRI